MFRSLGRGAVGASVYLVSLGFMRRVSAGVVPGLVAGGCAFFSAVLVSVFVSGKAWANAPVTIVGSTSAMGPLEGLPTESLMA